MDDAKTTESTLRNKHKNKHSSMKNTRSSDRLSDETIKRSLASEINICISDISFKELKHRTKYLDIDSSFRLIKRRTMTFEQFQDATSNLYKCCLTNVKDLHELHLRRKLGLRILIDLTRRAKPDYFQVPYIIHVLWSVMSCIHHFQIRLRFISTRIIKWARYRAAIKTLDVYNNLIKIILPSMHRIALNSIITLYREGRLWQMEFACTDLIIKLLSFYHHPEEGIGDIILSIEVTSLTDITESKFITYMLYSILDKTKWKTFSLILLKKLISMLEASIDPQPSDFYNYVPLRGGLQSCFRNITNNLNVKDLIILIFLLIKKINMRKKTNDEVVSAFGYVIILAAKSYKIKTGRKPLIKGPLPLLFGLFDSESYQAHLLAIKVWQQLIDRNDNYSFLITPRIFFRDCKYPLLLKPCIKMDKIFFKRFRRHIWKITTIHFHKAQTRWELENLFQFIALSLVEIPCGYTASCFVTVAMGMQEYALNRRDDNLIRSNHFHAVVMSIMTLICYIHKATTFYEYVNSVLERRAEWAPHLNPPLRCTYNYSQHHILWNKPDLFFEDWEARFGLWKCFRSRKRKNIIPIKRKSIYKLKTYFAYEPE